MNTTLILAIALAAVVAVSSLLLTRIRAESRSRVLSEYITNNMPSGLVVVDSRGYITGHNPASQRIFGAEMGTGRRFSDLVVEGRELQALLERCLSTGETFTRKEFNVSEGAAAAERIGVNLSPITNAKRQTDGVLCLLSDLTEVVRLQEQVRLKENFAALGEMSAGIAHEFKNSLSTISGYAQLLEKDPSDKSARNFANEIYKETRSLATIVSEFLNFARPVSASLQEVLVQDLLADAIKDAAHLRPGDYDLRLEGGDAGSIACDVTLIKQSLVNLLINAVDSLEEGGSIRVQAKLPDGRQQLRITITDTGTGMTEDELGKVFIPFFTTKTASTGLGLSLVQKIVLAHNGRIDIASQLGEGTSVTLTFPSIQNSSEPA